MNSQGINQSLFNSEPPKPLTPILKDIRSQSLDCSPRTDCYGNPIVKGSKSYKIKFTEKNDVYLVENWKQYNTDVTIQEPPCICSIQ